MSCRWTISLKHLIIYWTQERQLLSICSHRKFFPDSNGHLSASDRTHWQSTKRWELEDGMPMLEKWSNTFSTQHSEFKCPPNPTALQGISRALYTKNHRGAKVETEKGAQEMHDLRVTPENSGIPESSQTEGPEAYTSRGVQAGKNLSAEEF